MKHKTSHSYDMKMREGYPKLEKTKAGIQLMCPFCEIPHPLYPDMVSECGTIVRVTAIQTVVPPKLAKREKIVCLKCGKTGEGEMVRYMKGYIHMKDCNPEKKMITELPKFSRLAKFAFGLPETNPLRRAIERRHGKAREVAEIDAQGKETGKVYGYYFHKQVKHAEHPTTGS